MRLETISCEFEQICATGNALMLLETILCEFGQICATGNSYAAGSNFIQVWTDLWDRKRSHAAGNDFMRTWTDLCNRKWSCVARTKFMQLTVGRNSILNFPAKIWTRMCRALLCCDDSSSSQGQSGKRLLLAFRGHPILTLPQGWLLVPQGSEPIPWTRPQMPPGPTTPWPFDY